MSNQYTDIRGSSAANPLYRSGRLPLLDALTTAGLLGFDRKARAKAVTLLELTPGDRVVEIACGTGRTLPLLAGHVGADGVVVGIDRSPALMKRAKQRVKDFPGVELRLGDWLDADLGQPMDAAICVLGLSVLDEWERALDRMLHSVRQGGHLSIVDWIFDGTANGPAWNAYVRLASRLVGADPERRIFTAARARLREATCHRLPMGLQIVAGVHA
jgi:ubiquinone/menaquinone biosynthesis C-methylase UbiE